MGGNYEKGLYNQLMEAMARLDAVLIYFRALFLDIAGI